jgi:hypothetical protein
MLIAAELAADVAHARAGAAVLRVAWRGNRRGQGVLSLTLDQPWPHGDQEVEELTRVTLDLLATRWVHTVADGRRQITAHLAGAP